MSINAIEARDLGIQDAIHRYVFKQYDTQPTAGSDGIAPVDQIQNARKVVLPFQNDTLSVHPEAILKTQEAAKIEAEKSKDSSKETAPKRGWLDKLYDLSQYVWGLVVSKEEAPQLNQASDTTEGVADADNEAARTAKAKDARAFVEEMKLLLKRLKDLQDDDLTMQSFEMHLCDIYREQIRHKEEDASLSREKIYNAQQDKRQLHKERLAKLDDIINHKEHSKLWNNFDKAATALGLVAAGASIASGWGVVAFLVGVGMAADQMLDDPAKRKAAEILGGNDQEKQNKWLSWLQIGSGVTSIAVCAGLGGSGVAQGAINMSKGTSTSVRGMVDHQQNQIEADLKHLSSRGIKYDDTSKRELSAAKSIIDNVYNHYQSLSEITKNQLEAALSLTR